MHWTALIARRHTAPHVQIVQDLSCIGCGYNLRGLLASGACPECSLPAGDSLFRLTRPDATAAALRTVGRTFITPALLLLSPLAGVFGVGVLWLVLGGLALGTGLRLIATWELRYRCGIERLPVLDGRVSLMWWTAILEMIVAAATLVLYYLALTITTPAQLTLQAAFGWVLAAWVSGLAVVAVIAGSFGVVLAGLLDWDFVAREFRRQRLFLAIALGFVVLGALLAATVQAFGGSGRAGLIIVVIGLLIALGAIGISILFTVIGFLHLGAAAERERDRREDVLAVAAPREEEPTSRPQRTAEDLPEIPLE